MPSQQLTLLVQVDAFRYDYLSEGNTPFLFQIASESIWGTLQPTFGFEPDGAYLAGLYPDECDGGAHYWYQPEETPFRIAKYLPGVLDRLPGITKKAFRKGLTEWVRRRTEYKYETVANIPLKTMPFFAPAEKKLLTAPDYLHGRGIFALCEANAIPWLSHASPSYPVGIEAGLARLKRELKPPIGFGFWHIGDLDKAGHRFGPGSEELKKALRRVDAGISKVWNVLKSRYDALQLLIIGDHGMVEVTGVVDVEKALREAGIELGVKVLPFLDSTMARFWFQDGEMAEPVSRALEGLEGGRILGQTDRDRYHLNYAHNRFGDLIFLADPGILISPNYYQDKAVVKGMHGYSPDIPGQQSAFIVHASGITTPRKVDGALDMRRIFPTVLKLLGLKPPATCQVESVVSD